MTQTPDTSIAQNQAGLPPTGHTRIRAARHEDCAECAAIVRDLFAESAAPLPAYDEQRARQQLMQHIAAGQFALVVENTTDGIVGGMCAQITSAWYSSEAVAEEMVLYLKPAYRGGVWAHRLVSAFIAWAQLAGVRHICAGTATQSAAAAALYRRMGFSDAGIMFYQPVHSKEK